MQMFESKPPTVTNHNTPTGLIKDIMTAANVNVYDNNYFYTTFRRKKTIGEGGGNSY